ncbi:MAG: DUF1993 domain-containing protein [Cellvibrio sp.]|jgi:hypothetical protein
MLHELTVVQFSRMLTNLNLLLDKAAASAEARKFKVEVLLQARLAPDQFHFIRQVQIACDTAKLGVARLTGKTAPTHEDNETTLEQLKTRIAETLDYLASVSPQDFAGAEERQVSQQRWEGKYLTGTDYVVQYAVPNFYFHVTTAYAILRHNGVDLGKKDYLGALSFKTA